MKFISVLLVAMALVFCGTQAYAKNYATVINHQNGKKYQSNEFSYRKDLNNVIVYYEEPGNVDRFFQPKDKIKVTTKVGEVKIISDTEFKLDDITISYRNNKFYFDGSVVVKKNNKKGITLTTKNDSNISVTDISVIVTRKGYTLTAQFDREMKTLGFFID